MHSPLRVTTKQADEEARIFAQEFLLPAEAMHAEMQAPITLTSLAAMKPRWNVSIAFLAKRAESLSLITRNQHRYLIQQMHSTWGRESEPGDESVTAEQPRLLRKMAELLYGDPLDIGRLARESGMPQKLLRDILGVEQAPGRLLEFRKQ